MDAPTTFFKWTIVLVIIAGLAFSPSVIRYVSLSPIQRTDPASGTNVVPFYEPEKQEELDPALPVRFRIPKINIDAAVERVGLTPEGDMDAPKGPASVAWYSQGPHPGEQGSAVVAGHFGWIDDIPAVFDNLHTLQPGDHVYVEDEKGATITFVVREFRMYNPNEEAVNVFGSNDGKAHLNLITCQGVWNKDQKSYSTRLVVFADQEMQQ
jgi:sortase A